VLHAELIKKSFCVLEFLHKNGRLGEPELNQMWHVATKKHEAFRHAIFKGLTHLATKCLKIEEIRLLFTKVKLMSNKHHDKSSLAFLK
jgi:hypothetical protein